MKNVQKLSAVLILYAFFLAAMSGCVFHRQGLVVNRADVLLDGGSVEVYMMDGGRRVFVRADNSMDRDPSAVVLSVDVDGEKIDPLSKDAEILLLKLFGWVEQWPQESAKRDGIHRDSVIALLQTVCENPQGVAIRNDKCLKFLRP